MNTTIFQHFTRVNSLYYVKCGLTKNRIPCLYPQNHASSYKDFPVLSISEDYHILLTKKEEIDARYGYEITDASCNKYNINPHHLGQIFIIRDSKFLLNPREICPQCGINLIYTNHQVLTRPCWQCEINT